MKTTIGGDRLGAGGKMKVDLHGFERSTHDLGYIWRSTMAAGTLVPFCVQVGLPQDSWDIDLNAHVITEPTVGPLFGSYKLQLDMFEIPVRLYQSGLHNNMLNIGRKMEQVVLPKYELRTWGNVPITNNSQINPSSIFHYLGVGGIGKPETLTASYLRRKYNAIPWIGYWDIYKNFYANKQEEIGVVVHTEVNNVPHTIDEVNIDGTVIEQKGGTYTSHNISPTTTVFVEYSAPIDPSTILLIGSTIPDATIPNITRRLTDVFSNIVDNGVDEIQASIPHGEMASIGEWDYQGAGPQPPSPISLTTFPLENLDNIRNAILEQPWNQEFLISPQAPGSTEAPFELAQQNTTDGQTSITYSQEGLAIKTYQSDLFNNWMKTEWIDGTGGINEITAVDTSDGNFTIDALRLANKMNNMLNRVAISDGSYKAWMEVNYDNEGYWMTEIPIYIGSLIKEVVFQEVVSNSASTTDGVTQPLGQMAGRGVMSPKHKGGRINTRLKEHSYIMGIVSLTPRIDYSQGTKWWNHIDNMNDFHKPALDQIGYQDLIMEQMAWWDTTITGINEVVTHSAGKQPAWVNYMTNINETHGNFAIENNEMWMTLNRRYEWDGEYGVNHGIKDATTYIDPAKFNFIFAQTSLDSQNFRVQISVDATVRRKMSAKLMPNL